MGIWRFLSEFVLAAPGSTEREAAAKRGNAYATAITKSDLPATQSHRAPHAAELEHVMGIRVSTWHVINYTPVLSRVHPVI